jgi:hypothetical protein
MAKLELICSTYKRLGCFAGLVPSQYRKEGARRWSKGLVPPVAGRAALEALIGPVAAFELLPTVAGPHSAADPHTSPPPETTRQKQAAADQPAEPISEAAIGVPVLHPPLPGEPPPTPQGPPPVQRGMLGVIATPPRDPLPEPGAFEAEDAEPAPLPADAKPSVYWLAELVKRQAAHPPPRAWGDPTDAVKLMFWHERQDAIRAAWEIEWREAAQAAAASSTVAGGEA